jgi:D-threo-aldose 1-dehydrogenase
MELPLIGKPTSRIGFGTGGLLRTASARGRQSILAAALANGVTHFDTAPIYGFGESERALGRFLQGRRHEVTLTTKFGLHPSTLAIRLAPLQHAARRALQVLPALRPLAVRRSAVLYAPPCFSMPDVQASLEASLKALRTEYVDFYLAHEASTDALPGEALIELLQGLRRAGKILAFGIATGFEKVAPVLERRPQLANVVQFDSDLSEPRRTPCGEGPERLLITYGALRRSIALCRARLSGGPLGDLARMDDEGLGGMLLRAAVLANPRGIVLMQSRLSARIARNVRAASSEANDEQVGALAGLFAPHA